MGKTAIRVRLVGLFFVAVLLFTLGFQSQNTSNTSIYITPTVVSTQQMNER